MVAPGVIGGWLYVVDRWYPPTEIIVGAVPVYVFERKEIQFSGEPKKTTFIEHGISFIVRFQNGVRTVSVSGIDVRYCQMLWMGEVRRRSPEPSNRP